MRIPFGYRIILYRIISLFFALLWIAIFYHKSEGECIPKALSCISFTIIYVLTISWVISYSVTRLSQINIFFLKPFEIHTQILKKLEWLNETTNDTDGVPISNMERYFPDFLFPDKIKAFEKIHILPAFIIAIILFLIRLTLVVGITIWIGFLGTILPIIFILASILCIPIIFYIFLFVNIFDSNIIKCVGHLIESFNEIGNYSIENLLIAFAFYFIAPLIILLLIPFISRKKQYLKENSTFRQLFVEGRGGSARWAGIATYENMNQGLYLIDTVTGEKSTENRNIILGKSLFDDDPFRNTVGILDDTHIITIGQSGSGKSTTVLKPNLAMYEGSVIVFDPKGELAESTYRRRCSKQILEKQGVKGRTKSHLNGKCYILDPFKETNDLPVNNYNLLSEIDIHSDRAREMLSAISDGCVTPEGKENDHFVELAKYFIEGVIAHVLTVYPKKCHNLVFVFDLIHGIDSELKVADPTKFTELLKDMMKNDAVGGLPQQIAVKLLEMSDKERGSVLSTISRSIKWISDPAMRKHLISSDFEFSEVNINLNSVYIVLPDGIINQQIRWLRTLISISIAILRNSYKPKIPTLLIMDEFPRLGGRIKEVEEGFGILRGYGIKLWAILQDIGQLQRDYPESWSSMMGNSTVQIFGIRDIKTAEWVSNFIGSTVHRRSDGREGFMKMYKQKVVDERIYPLLTSNEVVNKFGKSSNMQVVIPTDGLPMRLERLAYKPLNFNGKKFRAYPLKYHFEDW